MLKKIVRISLMIILAAGVAALVWYYGFKEPVNREDNFVDTYTQILIIRAKYPNDTAKANPMVRTVIEEYGYTQESFKSEYSMYAQDSKKFLTMLDSAKERAKREFSPAPEPIKTPEPQNQNDSAVKN